MHFWLTLTAAICKQVSLHSLSNRLNMKQFQLVFAVGQKGSRGEVVPFGANAAVLWALWVGQPLLLLINSIRPRGTHAQWQRAFA